jgi:hypothetical protein
MDSRLRDVLSHQQAARFAGLAGSEAEATIRISDQLLNEVIAAYVPPGGALRTVVMGSHAGNRVDLAVTLAKPAFLPPIPLTITIERQPELPADATLVLRLAGGAGHLMRLAGPMLTHKLPSFVRLDGERLLINLRGALQERDQEALLDHVQQLQIVTEEGRLVVHTAARVL